MTWERTQDPAADRAALSADLQRLALAHRALDELGVPRASDGERLSLFGRIEALRAGKYDPTRLSPPAGAAAPQCPRCALLALPVLDAE